MDPLGCPWQPSAALGAPNQAVSGGLCPTGQDPLDSVRELLNGLKDSMKAEFSSLNSVNETLKDSLMKSPLTDKIVGLSLQKSPGRS